MGGGNRPPKRLASRANNLSYQGGSAAPGRLGWSCTLADAGGFTYARPRGPLKQRLTVDRGRGAKPTTPPPPGLRPAAVALRATLNSGLAFSSDRRARIPRVNLPMAAPFGLGSRRGICVCHRRCGTTSSARRERPLVHIRTRICAGDPVPLKPATLLPSSPTICRSGILKRLAGGVPIEAFDELDEGRLRHQPATTDLDAAQPSSTDELKRGRPSDAKTFHHLFDGVQPGARPACCWFHPILLCRFDTKLTINVSVMHSSIWIEFAQVRGNLCRCGAESGSKISTGASPQRSSAPGGIARRSG